MKKYKKTNNQGDKKQVKPTDKRLSNEFWKLRTKHGRDKIFTDPDILLQSAYDYFKWCDENPWVKNEAVKGGDLAGTLIQIPTARPYTISGLCIFLGVNTRYFDDFKTSLKEDENDFSSIITHIEETIRTQKFEGAAVGAFNANIIARDLGMIDKKEFGGEIGIKRITGMEIL